MALCLFLLHKAYQSGTGLPYLTLFANLSVINFFQVIIYVFLEHSLTIAIYAADTYLIAIYFLFTHFMQIALGLSENDNVYWTKYLYIPPAILTALHISGLMVESIRVNGRTICSMAMVSTHGQMAENMKDNTKMIKKTDKMPKVHLILL